VVRGQEQAELLIEMATIAKDTGLRRKEVFYSYMAAEQLGEVDQVRAA